MKKIITLLCFSMMSFAVSAQCDQVSIELTNTNDCLPLAIYNLEGQAPEGSSVQWSWLENPGNATLLLDEQNDFIVAISMTQPGVYQLQMQVELSGGTSCTEIFEKEIYALPEITTTLQESYSLCEASTEVELSLVNAAGFTEVDWVIGQDYSSDFNPSFTFNQADSYELSVIAVDVHGCTVNTTQEFTVLDGPSIENTTVSLTPSIGNTDCLQPATSYELNTEIDSEFAPHSIYWQNTAQTTSVDHSIDITVANNSGQSFSYPIQLNFEHCTLSYELEHSYTVEHNVNFISNYAGQKLCAGETITLTNISNQLAWDPNFVWNLPTANVISENANAVTFEYSEDGIYQWGLNYLGECESSTSQFEFVDVDIIEPILADGLNQLSCEDMAPVVLAHDSELEEDENYNFFWSLSAPSIPAVTSSLETAPLVLTEPGVYDLSLTISNADGTCSAELEYPDFFTLGGIDLGLTAELQQYCMGESINTVDLIENQEVAQYSYLWELINQDFQTVSSASGYNGVLEAPQEGSYLVQLAIEDMQSSCSDVVSNDIVEVLQDPNVNILSENLDYCSDPSIDVTADASILLDTIVEFNWNLYQGSTLVNNSVGVSYNHTLESPGMYSLEAMYSDGVCSSSDQIDISYEAMWHQSSWQWQDASFSICEGEHIIPHDHVSIPTSNSVIVQWNLLQYDSDVLVESSNNVNVEFSPEPGSYRVELELSSSISDCEYKEIVSPIISVISNPNYTTNFQDIDICELPYSVSDVVLDAPTMETSVNWELVKDDNTLDVGGELFDYNFTQNGVYNLHQTITELGCSTVYIAQFTINNVQLEYLGETAGDQCIDYALSPIDYFDASGLEDVTYLWQLVDEQGEIYKSSAAANPMFLMDEPGAFDLFVQLYSETNECVYDTTIESFVSILDLEVVLQDAYTSCDLPFEVNFEHNSDLSSLPNANFLWTLYYVDGSVLEIINQEEANYTYNTEGLYDVALTITDPVLGCSDTELMAEAVFIDEIEIDLDDSTPFSSSCLPYSFHAGDIDLTQYANANYTYEWTLIDSLGNNYQASVNSFGDFTIEESGIYDLQFQLTNVDINCTDVVVLEDFVMVNDITMSVALLDSPDCFTGQAPLIKSIVVDEFMTDINTPLNIVNHTWQVSPSGGVTTESSNQDSLQLAFTEPGDYTVTYTLFLDGGTCVYTDQLEFSLGVIPSFENPSPICLGESFDLSENSSIGIGALTAFEWLPSAELNVDDFHSPQTSISASSAGEHSLALVVNNDLGCVDTLHQVVEVYEVVADFVVSDSLLLCSGSEVNMLSINNDYINSYIWTITEDAPIVVSSSTPAYTHVFNQVGSANVQLSIESEHGCSDTVMKEDLIQLDEFDVAILDYEADSCFNTLSSIQKTFGISISSLLGSDYTISNFEWQISPNNGVSTAHESVDSLALVFTEPGEYTLSYSLILNDGSCVYTDQISFDMGVTTAINAPSIICAGLPFGVSESSSIAIGASTAYSWSSISSLNIDDYTSQTPNISAELPGVYPLTLAVVNDMGCIVSETVDVEVYDTQANFVLSDSIFDCAPASVQFTSLNNQYINSYTWNINQHFADGGNFQSNYVASNPDYNYVFTSAAISDIELVIEMEHGCKDTLMLAEAMQVNDIEVSILPADDAVWCFNGAENLSIDFEIDLEYLYQTPIFLENHLWQITPNEGVTISNDMEMGITLDFTVPGTYTLNYSASSDDNACDYSDSFVFDVGVDADVTVPEVICVGNEFPIDAQIAINTQENTSVSWLSSDLEIDDESALSSQITATYPGQFELDFTVTNSEGCWATISSQVEVYQVEALVFSPDSGEQCRPAIVDFESVNNDYINSYTWNITQNFGDQTLYFTENSTSTEYTHLFNEVGLSDVELIISSEHGCADTSTVEGFIDVIAPMPYFSLEPNFAGCDSFLVSIVDSSNFIDSYWIDYGNGYIPDYTIGETNTVMYHYPYGETMDWNEEYYITLHAEYKFCEASFVDTVRVYPRPQIEITVSDMVGCVPFGVSFEDNSLYVYEDLSEYHWDFGDGQSSNLQNPFHVYEEPGVYQIYHEVTSQNQCSEDSLWVQTIEVYNPPVADYTAETPDFCYGNAYVQFEDLSTHDSDTLLYLWNASSQDALEQNPVIYFDEPGLYGVTLSITDSHGCVDDTIKYVDVVILDTLVNMPFINYVSVENNEVLVDWADTLDDNFGSVWLYHQELESDWDLVYYSDTAQPSFYYHDDIDDVNLNNYRLVVQDSCGYYSDSSLLHTTILLDLSSNQYQRVDLNWTAYVGWDSVAYYSIYRTDMSTDFEWIADVPGDSLHYQDSSLCNIDYGYYVKAVHPNGAFYSNSNIRIIEPLFIDFTQPMLLKFTTVNNENTVITHWDTYYESEMTFYNIDRWDEYFGWVEDFDVISEPPYIDTEAASSHMKYKYRISYEDICGNVGPHSRVGTNIVLGGDQYTSHYDLNWTQYEEWQGDVASHRLQYYNADEDIFQDVVELDGEQFSYVDSELDKPGIDTSYCYRVIALSHDNEGYRSYSNKQCFVPRPKHYFANAFSPNDDNINETFFFSGSFAKSLNISIYDRWGREVFKSDRVDFEWDGYSDIDGALCMQGAYVVRYEIVGFDEAIIREEMVLFLLR